MKKINVGIVGYGNLGKALEELILENTEFNLKAIFSRHIKQDCFSKFNTPIYNFKKIEKFKNKINTIFLSVGSHKDCEIIGKRILANYNMIDCYDTHAKMNAYLLSLDNMAKESEHVGISAFGWDPGILSLFRVVFSITSNTDSISLWGKGVSQGHSEVLRKIRGVKNAIQFTIPKNIKHTQTFFDKNKLHKRLCYIALRKEYENKKEKMRIINEIKNTKNYFKNQNTIIKFKKENKIIKMQKKLFHKGKIINNFKLLNKYKNNLLLKINLSDNPHFTAHIMLSAIHAVTHLTQQKKYGNYSILELPIYYFSKLKRNELINKFL